MPALSTSLLSEEAAYGFNPFAVVQEPEEVEHIPTKLKQREAWEEQTGYQTPSGGCPVAGAAPNLSPARRLPVIECW
jgi:hypothetical protein